LLDGYEVFGVIKPNTNSLQKNTISLDLTDIKNVEFVISKVKPTHIFNFAGVSDVFNPYDNLEFSYQQNCLIPQNFLNSILKIDKTIRFFQSSSSLMYGRSTINKINEETPTSPIYPYGITKLYSHNLIKEYREEFDLFCSSGIFFNHDSEKRGDKFLTQKIILGIKDILNKKTNTIKLGNIDVAFYTKIAGGQKDGLRKGDAVSDVAGKLFNLVQNHNEKNNYQYTDVSSLTNNYYRIAQMDNTGIKTNYKTIKIENVANNNLVFNHCINGNNIEVRIDNAKAGKASITLYSVAGNLISTTPITLENNSSAFAIPKPMIISHLNLSMYLSLLYSKPLSMKYK
jgi:GDP-mannose 4,6-dehydratase